MNVLPLALALVLSISVSAFAQPDSQAAGQGLGSVTFETSCAPDTRAGFNRAVALLHSFEYRAAMDGFTEVLAADPACAIALWGVAMCHWGNPFAGVKSGPLLERGREAAARGMSTGSPTPRERAYIAAVGELYKDAAAATHRERTINYARAMEALQRDYPRDVEARIFYALAVNQTAVPTDKTYAAQLRAAQILEPLWQQYPNHPGLPHYIIHAYDHPPLAPRALAAARRYAEIAPAAPHALHMPSHTFTRVGSWRESAATNLKSERISLQQNVISEALHAMDYQAYAYLQMARDREARALLDRMPGVVARLDLHAMGGAAPPAAGIYARNAIAARYALERGAWTEAASLPALSSPFPNADAITHYARALGAARSGRARDARADVNRLAALGDALRAAKDDYWAEQVDIERQIALAWMAFGDGQRAEGLRLMRAAADQEDKTDKAAISPGPIAPARELLGEMLLESGNATDALAAFAATMEKEPNRFRGAYGAARAAEALGRRELATRYYRQVIEIARDADSDRPELQHARAYAR